MHDRAKIILCCLKGKANLETAAELKVSRFTVAKWRGRFSAKGIKALSDRPRAGKPKKYDANLRTNILRALEGPVPKGQSTWDGKSLARVVGASDDAVWRILRGEGIQLQRCRRVASAQTKNLQRSRPISYGFI